MTDQEFANELRKWWSFDDRQHHTHSWHDREDFIEKRLPELLATIRRIGVGYWQIPELISNPAPNAATAPDLRALKTAKG